MALSAIDFPPGTPLHHFFAWNEAAWLPDRRYRLARDPDRLPASPAGKRLSDSLAAAIGNPDRVYDLHTATRSNVYAWLLLPGMPEWSGIAWRSSHPHANLDRDRQHTLDKQAEQLLMAGIYPTKLPALPPLDRKLPERLEDRDFVVLVPGSSPRHPAKRWPGARFAMLARALDAKGYLPVVVGSAH